MVHLLDFAHHPVRRILRETMRNGDAKLLLEIFIQPQPAALKFNLPGPRADGDKFLQLLQAQQYDSTMANARDTATIKTTDMIWV